MQNFILRRLLTTGSPPCKHMAGAQSDDLPQKTSINGSSQRIETAFSQHSSTVNEKSSDKVAS